MTLPVDTSKLPENALFGASTRSTRETTPLDELLTGRIDFTLPSTVATVDRMEQEAERFAIAHGFSEDDAANIAMAAREATVNAVMHGNAYSQDKQVRASLECDATTLTIHLQDEGPGFNAAVLPDPLSPENILRSSGRGVFLMRALMDEVHFRQLEPGTELTMIKHRSAEAQSR